MTVTGPVSCYKHLDLSQHSWPWLGAVWQYIHRWFFTPNDWCNMINNHDFVTEAAISVSFCSIYADILCHVQILCAYDYVLMYIKMTSSNGNIFRVTGPLCGEFTGPGEFPTQRPVTRSFDVFSDLRLNKWLNKQPWGWWFETPSWSYDVSHYDVSVMCPYHLLNVKLIGKNMSDHMILLLIVKY